VNRRKDADTQLHITTVHCAKAVAAVLCVALLLVQALDVCARRLLLLLLVVLALLLVLLLQAQLLVLVLLSQVHLHLPHGDA
jgi:hypothetical protein